MKWRKYPGKQRLHVWTFSSQYLQKFSSKSLDSELQNKDFKQEHSDQDSLWLKDLATFIGKKNVCIKMAIPQAICKVYFAYKYAF